MKKTMSMPLAALCTVLLAACSSQPTSAGNDDAPPANDGTAQACNADAARGFVGQVATADVVEQARKAAGAGIARTLKPGQVVTMEYRGDRLDIDVDASNVVTGVRCG